MYIVQRFMVPVNCSLPQSPFSLRLIIETAENSMIKLLPIFLDSFHEIMTGTLYFSIWRNLEKTRSLKIQNWKIIKSKQTPPKTENQNLQ